MDYHVQNQLPAKVPVKSSTVCILLLLTSCVTSTTLGFDGSMMNGLNILPSYTEYFTLTTATLALNTSSVWIGTMVISVLCAKFPDWIGRKWCLFYGSIITFIGVIIQTCAQNIVMFVISRMILGAGTGLSSLVAPIYLAETLPVKYRAWGLGAFFDCWYVGALIAAGITYRTAEFQSTWAWRTPSALQGLFSIVCILIIPFTPESPRWLQSQGQSDKALVALAQITADGDASNPDVQLQFRQIVEALAYEKAQGVNLTVPQIIKNKDTRKRLFLALTVAVFCMLSGNNIISYYLGTMLSQAGITDSTTQLEINIILNSFCLVVAVAGTYFSDKIGRKWLAASSTALMTIFLFIVGALTKVYGESTHTPGIYGTVAAIFLFQGSYSFGWTPLTVLYPPEVLSYNIRATGMSVWTFLNTGIGMMVTFSFPFALQAIGWKTYMINGAWDVVELAVVLIFWVETRGRTLEEIDADLEGDKGGLAAIDGVKLEEEKSLDLEKAKETGAGQPVIEVKSLA